MWCRSAVNFSFFLSLAVFRTRSKPWDAPSRLGVRSVSPCPAFPLVPALGSPDSSTGRPASFVGFDATVAGSDFSGPFIVGYGSSPSRRGPARRDAARPGKRPPRFRRCLFARDGVFDPGGASASRITTPHMSPSTLLTVSAPAIFWLSRLNSPPHAIVVYASQPPSPTTPQHSLPGARYGLPGPDFHRLDSASFPGAQAIHDAAAAIDCLPPGLTPTRFTHLKSQGLPSPASWGRGTRRAQPREKHGEFDLRECGRFNPGVAMTALILVRPPLMLLSS